MTVRRRAAIITLAAVIVLVLGCWVVAPDFLFGPTVYVRNETSGLAWVGVSGPWGRDSDEISVPAWKPGMCTAGAWTWHHYGRPLNVENASHQIGTAGPAESSVGTFVDGKPLYIRIDSAGVIHIGEPLPENPAGCTQYAIRSGWEWREGE